MPAAVDFRNVACQFSVFTRDFQFQSAKAMGVLLAKYAEILDGDPQVLPQMSNFQMPIEIPQVVLRNAAGSLVVSLGAARIDITRTGDPLSETEVELFVDQSGDMALKYLGMMSATACRLAFSVSRKSNAPSPANFLAQHFCKESVVAGPINRPADFELHALKRYSLNEFEVNSWVRCKTGLLKVSGEGKANDSALIVEQDINTLAENSSSANFDTQHIKRFFSSVPSEMATILKLYFPD